MTSMSNTFNLSGHEALIGINEQTTGYPKVKDSSNTTSTLNTKYITTASDSSGYTKLNKVYNIIQPLNLTSKATITNTPGATDQVQFALTSRYICNLIVVNDVTVNISAATIEGSNNGSTWTAFSAKVIEADSTNYYLQFTNNTAYLYYRFGLADLTHIATSEVSIYLNDGPARIIRNPDTTTSFDIPYYYVQITLADNDFSIIDSTTNFLVGHGNVVDFIITAPTNTTTSNKSTMASNNSGGIDVKVLEVISGLSGLYIVYDLTLTYQLIRILLADNDFSITNSNTNLMIGHSATSTITLYETTYSMSTRNTTSSDNASGSETRKLEYISGVSSGFIGYSEA